MLCSALLFLEITASFFLKKENTLNRILKILQQDQNLFWRQKPNLNVIFEGARVQTNGLGMRFKELWNPKKENTIRIICLGASPTFGWGVEKEQTYSRQLNLLLNREFPQKDIEVINAGMIGYSSYQGVQFLKKEILNLSPDIITVSYVINDVDKYRFFRSNGKSDKELKPKSKFLIDFENILYESKFVNLYKNILIKFQSKAIQYFGNSGKNKYLEKRRVSTLDYRENIKEIIRLAQKNKIRVILIKMPINLPAAPQIPVQRQKKVDKYIEKALISEQKGQYARAINELRIAVKMNPYSAKSFFYLGKFYEKIGQVSEAKKYFKESKKKELNECGRLGLVYNRIMEEVADRQGVAMVNAVSLLKEYKKTNKMSLFQINRNDLIHPNQLGHKIIGEALFDTFIKNNLIK